MDEKAVIKGTSTLGESMKEVPVTENTATTETQNSNPLAVNTSGQLETATASTEPTATEITSETTTQEEDSSVFDFPYGEENKAAETQSQPQQPQINLDEILAKFDKKEVAKKLGLDDFDIEFSDYRKKGGDPTKYLSAKAIDYNKVNDVDLVKSDFNEKYAGLSPEDRAYLFNKKFIATELDEDDVQRDKRIELQVAANDIRQKRIAEQQSFKMPDVIQPEQDQDYLDWKNGNEQLNQTYEKYKSYLENDEATKNLLQNKRVAIKVDKNGTVFNFNIEKPEVLMNALLDKGQTLRKMIYNEKGEPDILKQQQILLFASDPIGYAEKIFNYGKSQGQKAMAMQSTNATRQIGTQPRNGSTETTEREAWKNARSSTLAGN